MKSIHRIIAIVTLGSAAMATGSSALAQDTDTCRGGYRIMLMTTAECQTYLKQLKAVRARSDRMAELELREWHTALLIQRAEDCRCLGGNSVVLLQRGKGPQQKQIN